jgi:hypothetical protein
MNRRSNVQLAITTKASMISHYVVRKIAEQVRAVSFIVVYLVLFQFVVLRRPGSIQVSHLLGIMAVVAGLTFFLEGLFLGLMPLGESVGLKLPRRTRLLQMVIFALVIGFVSTLAEPAISTLRSAGSGVLPWEHPLLFTLLEVHTGALIGAVGGGVALAVALSMFRFYRGISLKPFILVILPILLAGTLAFSFHPNLRSVIGLAWDTGAVTTGPVTVPLVLALGIGVSRASGDTTRTSGGFGSIALASLLPVLGVMILSFGLSFTVPQPMSGEAFFSPESKSDALYLLGSQQRIDEYGSAHGFLEDDPDTAGITSVQSDQIISGDIARIVYQESASALKAIIPLAGILAIVLFLLLRERLHYLDEFVFGLIITIIGMILLTSGIRFGLVPLGDTVGKQLPQVYTAQEHEQVIEIPDFDLSLVQQAVDGDGHKTSYFMFMNDSGKTEQKIFYPDQYDTNTGRYAHIQRTPVLFDQRLTTISMIFVLLFAFGLGYGSTLAEPALNALGRNIEEVTVGTVTKNGVIRAVSIGVGLGITCGVVRIIYDIPLAFMLLPVYILLIPLTVFSDKEFTGIAWDSGGVTTGPITVPLVLALGLGIGGAMGIADGFGILALASAFPILTVQVYGFMISIRRGKILKVLEQEAADGQ